MLLFKLQCLFTVPLFLRCRMPMTRSDKKSAKNAGNCRLMAAHTVFISTVVGRREGRVLLLLLFLTCVKSHTPASATAVPTIAQEDSGLRK